MSLLFDGAPSTGPGREREARTRLESLVVKNLLSASGAFRPAQLAGGGLFADLLVEAIAEAVAAQGALELAPPPAAPAPAPERAVTSGFGPRADPFDQAVRFHRGVDVGAPRGAPIHAVEAGVVTQAGPRGGYGNAVEVRHADGTSTLYAHAEQIHVAAGDEVAAGAPLATVGDTGRATGPHLHFERRHPDGSPAVPTGYRRALQDPEPRAEEPARASSRFRGVR